MVVVCLRRAKLVWSSVGDKAGSLKGEREVGQVCRLAIAETFVMKKGWLLGHVSPYICSDSVYRVLAGEARCDVYVKSTAAMAGLSWQWRALGRGANEKTAVPW